MLSITWKTPRRLFVGIVAVALAASGITIGAVAAESATQRADAAVASAFDPGYLISDANFYNGNALSASGVQAFLNSVAPSCRQQSGGPACLKNYTQNVGNIAAVSGRCSAIAAGTKSAATIIAQVGQACNISQKALLVLLEKEQGIVSTSRPTSYMYQHATGFACPDTAPCDPTYRGFAQQVYAAGLQFQRYKANPTLWAYRAGRTNNILYNPNGACGTKSVYIQNAATAGLYIYTPYTPNQAALNNLYGTGDGCSAYGNRNFWRIFTDWFGNPTGGSSDPIGSVDVVTGGAGSVHASGWAADPDTTGPLRVSFYIDGAVQLAVTADAQRSDLAGVLGAGNTAHGWSTTITGVSPGDHSLCVFAINKGAGANTLLKCSPFSVQGGPPKGSLDAVVGGAGTIAVRGWAFDADGTAPYAYKVQVDGVGAISAKTDVVRTDVQAAYPGIGSTVGFQRSISGVAAGRHTVSLWLQDLPGTAWTKITEQTTTVAAASSPSKPSTPTTGKTGKTGPVTGAFESATGGQGTVTVRGWGIDPDVYDPVRYKLHVDGVGAAAGTANATRTDVERSHPGWGADVGLSTTLQGITPGTHTVTMWLQDLPSGTYVRVGDKTVTVQTKPTGKTGTVQGAYDSVTGGQGTAVVRGWAIDPDTYAPVAYKIHVDGVGVQAGSVDTTTRTDVQKAHPGWGPEVGLTTTVSGLTPGKHTVRLWYQDLPSGTYRDFGTKTVTVAQKPTGKTGAVTGAFDTATGGKGTVRVTGWAIDPDTYDPVRYKIHLDGVGVTAGSATAVRPDVARVHPGWGSDVGLAVSLSGVTPGRHTVRVWYQDLPDGAYRDFGTKTVTVS